MSFFFYTFCFFIFYNSVLLYEYFKDKKIIYCLQKINHKFDILKIKDNNYFRIIPIMKINIFNNSFSLP